VEGVEEQRENAKRVIPQVTSRRDPVVRLNPLEGVKNPKGDTGMKQDRASERGVSRREGEKPCGRNVPGVASRGGVDSLGLSVEGAQNSMRGAARRVFGFGGK
jgi:hypothetical protein